MIITMYENAFTWSLNVQMHYELQVVSPLASRGSGKFFFDIVPIVATPLKRRFVVFSQ